MMEEIWKDIEGYEGKYMVSNFGRVKSLKDRYGNYREKIFKPCNDGHGYYFVLLCSNGKPKPFKIHRLVAQTYIPNPDNLDQVNHKDENKQNNCVNNLEWCTCKYNNCYGSRNERMSKSRSKKVACYKDGKIIKIYNAIKDVEKDGFYHSNVCRCCKGQYKSSGGYTWRYID